MSAENNELVCPVPSCGEVTYLSLIYAIPLYAKDPPWPGAGEATYGPADAVSNGWYVECVNGHRIWNDVDQIIAHNKNAAGGGAQDTTSDEAPVFSMEIYLAAHLPAIILAHPQEES